MITSIVFLILSGCFTLVNTSKKAVLNNDTVVEKWIQTHTIKSKYIGCGFLLLALAVSIFNFGLTSGILFWLIALMTLMSLVIIIAPLRVIRSKYLLFILLISLIIELLNYYAR